MQVDESEERITVHLAGEKVRLDEMTTAAVERELLAVAGRLGTRALWVILRDVVFLSSTGLGAFLSLRHTVQAGGGRLVLCDLTPAVHEVFLVTRTDKLFDIRNSEAPPGK